MGSDAVLPPQERPVSHLEGLAAKPGGFQRNACPRGCWPPVCSVFGVVRRIWGEGSKIAASGRDEAMGLVAALMGLMGRIRGHPYGGPPGESEEALHAEADRFILRLAEHLRYTEMTLFPALLKAEPGSSGEIEGPHLNDRLFHLHARDLALQFGGGVTKWAYESARVLLAVLLDHLRREAAEVDRSSGPIGASP